MAADHGFALAGGNALVAHGLVERPTLDVDLFTPEAGGPALVLDAVCAALREHGYAVQVCATRRTTTASSASSRSPERTHKPPRWTWLATPAGPVAPGLGTAPVLSRQDALGNKMGVVLGRGLPRDFIDIAAAVVHIDRGQLLEWAFTADPGLRVQDVAIAARRLDALPDRTFAEYGLDAAAVTELRDRLADWSRDPAADTVAHTAHARAHPPS